MSSHDCAQNSIQSPVAIPANVIRIAQCVLPRAPGTDVSSEDLQMGERLTHCQEEFDVLRGLCQAAGNKLTDDALLDIFDSYLNDNHVSDRLQNVNKWHTLVHVCRRWRNLVFASPRRLNLRLLCRKATPVREMLDIWPALPIEIEDIWMSTGEAGQDNIIAALEHPDRVRSITLTFVQRETLPAATQHMQVPFPELTSLRLWSSDRSARIIPNSFLGGSVPRLQALHLSGIPFPAAPNLLLSASDLVDLSLRGGSDSGYISPEAMVACLSSLNRLKSLDLGFESPQPRPDRQSRPPQTRVVLPALTNLSFTGMTDYSEDFLTRIDTPVLNNLSMSSSPHLVLGIPHFKNFISRTKCLKPPEGARVCFNRWCIPLALKLHQQHASGSVLEVMCGRIDLVTLICGQLSPFCSLIERLYFFLGHSPFKPQGEDNIGSAQLLELFRPFTAVRSFHVSKSLVPLVATALQVLIGPRATEVLPNLCDLFLGGSAMPGTVPEAMQPFLTTRQLSGRPVAVHHWEGVEADQ